MQPARVNEGEAIFQQLEAISLTILSRTAMPVSTVVFPELLCDVVQNSIAVTSHELLRMKDEAAAKVEAVLLTNGPLEKNASGDTQPQSETFSQVSEMSHSFGTGDIFKR